MTRKSDKAKLIFLLLYFLILTTERVISLVTVFTGDIAGYDLLDWYMTGLTVLSIICAYTFIALPVHGFPFRQRKGVCGAGAGRQ